MHSKNKLKLYILIICGLVTLVLLKYKYEKIYHNNKFLLKEIKRNENMIKKIRKNINDLKTIKNSLKISSDKLKKFKLMLFNSKDATATLENLQKYIFDYFKNKGFEISDYRQLPIREKSKFYVCKIEVNFKANTDELMNIFDYFSKTNYLIIIDSFNVNYISSRKKRLRVRIVFSTIYLKKLKPV